ncbi:MAG TPA: tetratricopeptide repeat protein [Devosia sp.]|jgi:hypothetical protein|nr:tetratricopeptide repeat protein [Devosia sp.]
MLGHRFGFVALTLAGLLLAGPAAAAPEVVTLGSGPAGDPVAACGDMASSPWEAGREGGLTDEQVFIDGAIAACEAALEAEPQSAQAQAWLARAYFLAGRRDEAAALLETASAGGNPFAAYLLSEILGRQFGGGAAQDPDRAVSLLFAAADGGFAPALADLAARYETGNGLDADLFEAERLYGLAAEQDYGPAVYKLGYFAHAGFTAAADYARAAELYERAAALGEPLGNNGLGQLYEYGQGVTQDYARAVEYYTLAADAGEKMSQTALAYFYEQGLGVAQDYSRSFELLTAASGQDWGFAHAALAIHYLFGQGTAVDEGKAFDLAWRARGLGVVYAQGIIGYLYQNGLGTGRDLPQARFHYEEGANGGDQYSADQLPLVDAELACEDAAGSPHEPGSGGRGLPFEAIIPDDAIPLCENAVAANPQPVGNRVWLGRALARAERFDEAVPLLEEGVVAGNVLAHVVLGDLLMAGAGVDEDPERAIGLYRAVAQTFGPAQLSLGLAYANGIGVPQDREEALRWLRRADEMGVEEAVPELTALLGEGEGEADSVDLTGFGRAGPAY